MKVTKKVLGMLPKCYAITKLDYKGKSCFLICAEKEGNCFIFDEDGNKLESVWEGECGVMTMLQVPGSDGEFLSTYKFYGPNNATEASIVINTPTENGWERRTLVKARYVHRFGILERGGVNYLIVCCLKSGHEYKNDWRFPGAVYGAVLPKDLSAFNDDNQLELKLLKSGLLRNHGFSIAPWAGHTAAVVGAEEGTFLFEPPMLPGAEWTVTRLLDIPTSDAVLIDFDGDGQKELGVISDFHGSSLCIYHLNKFGNYVPQWKFPAPEADTEFLHATWADTILGKPAWVVGWRKGTRDTVLISWDAEAGTYQYEYIDKSTGCANAMHFVNAKGQDVVIGTNREIDEMAMYTLTED